MKLTADTNKHHLKRNLAYSKICSKLGKQIAKFRLLSPISKYFFALVFFATISWAVYIFAYGNFHRVDEYYYRSAQLFSFNMPYYIKKNGIKSVLNLRGVSKDDWYQDEVEILDQHKIVHYSYRIKDGKILTKEQMDDLIDIIDKAPKPILVHCKAGADRASLVTALYLHAIKREQNPEKAFSLKYGHFPWLGSRTKAMGDSFKLFKQEEIDKNDVLILEKSYSD